MHENSIAKFESQQKVDFGNAVKNLFVGSIVTAKDKNKLLSGCCHLTLAHGLNMKLQRTIFVRPLVNGIGIRQPETSLFCPLASHFIRKQQL